VLIEWRRLQRRRRQKILALPPAEFSTARRLKLVRRPDFTAASRKQVGGVAEGSSYSHPFRFHIFIARCLEGPFFTGQCMLVVDSL